MNTESVRRTIIEMSYRQGLSHVGSCLSCVEIICAIFDMMKPEDRFVLSAGHKGLALYSVLHEKGLLKTVDVKQLGCHPLRDDSLGIYTSTGSLGHGLTHGLGMAIAGKRTYVLLSDGEIQEGSTYEAIRLAGRFHLANLTAIVDCNGFTAYDSTHELENVGLWKNYGWRTEKVDGNNYEQVRKALEQCSILEPTVVLAKTIKGKGLERFEGKLGSHYWKIEKEDYEKYVCNRAA